MAGGVFQSGAVGRPGSARQWAYYGVVAVRLLDLESLSDTLMRSYVR